MKRVIGSLLFLSFLIASLSAQTPVEAKKLYDAGKYDQVKTFYEQQVKKTPNNAEYNLYYGVCLKQTGDWKNAEKYLQAAYLKKNMEAHLELAGLYYDLYDFGEALSVYEIYLKLLKPNQGAEKLRVEKLMDQTKNADRMLNFCEDIQIIDSIIVDKQRFLDAYHLSSMSGHVGYLEDGSVFYENQLRDKRYFTLYQGKEQLSRLYSQQKYSNEWTEPRVLQIPGASLGDQKYPFVMPDGITVYFASTSDKSIGGYDIFVTRYNSSNNTYYIPEQLGMPFNSIYNDYMLAIDEFNGVGYFASDRFMKPEEVVIYTFIPNEGKSILESKSADELKRRAQIVSIQDSWPSGENYYGLLDNIKQSLEQEAKQEKRDFVFVIQDDLVYYTLNDFRDLKARDAYVQALALKEKESVLARQLDGDRLAYSKGNATKKKALSSSILSNEAKLETMAGEYEQLILKARNAEVNYMQNKKK